MPNFNFAQDLLLEVAEMDRFQEFLGLQGYQLGLIDGTENFGIVKNQVLDPNFNFFKVVATGASDQIQILPGFAYAMIPNPNTTKVNSNILQTLVSYGVNATIPLENQWYWVQIGYASNNIEDGTVNIGGSNGGQMTGIGTKFTQVLRGQPNFPSKIQFINSVNYTEQYEVLSVSNDTTCYLQGVFDVAESGLQYEIVGTFTPGVYPSAAQQFPFEYDGFTYTLTPEITTDAAPPLIANQQFYIARVMASGGAVFIQDKRQNYVWQYRSERLFSEIPSKLNPLIAIENINQVTIRANQYYVTNFGWGFRIAAESRTPNLNQTSITQGSGGRYVGPASFSTGDFDGWRYYYSDGSWSRVVSSVANSGNILLQLDTLNNDLAGVMVAPNCEQVELIMSYTPDGTSTYISERFTFNNYTPSPQICIDSNRLATGHMTVNVTYRYKTNYNYTAESILNVNTYNLTNVGSVTSNEIILNGSSGTPPPNPFTWQGSGAYCQLQTLPQTVYWKLVQSSSTQQPMVYTPNSANPQFSSQQSTATLTAEFFSDSSFLNPLNVTLNGFYIPVKQSNSQTYTQYPTGGGSNSYSNIQQGYISFAVNVNAANSVVLGTVVTAAAEYEYPGGIISQQRQTYASTSTYAVYPSSTLFLGNTTYQGFTTLTQISNATGLPTGVTKPNLSSDPNYIAPAINLNNCGFVAPTNIVDYGYGLNVVAVNFVGSDSGAKSTPSISNTDAGGYQYLITPPFDSTESVTVQLQVATLDTGNNTGVIWCRITWYQTGSTSPTISQFQVPNNVLTTLTGTFTNIATVNISNY